ncbi:M13 family peptidase [Antrihabitans cavernicola]|uniref:M13 family peptidase n=2 Tax=Antrihabitans cavernicola TaxID=2495913 RepID=A0A5A7SGT0_9NOCA|nr:M13 family peptidase [Spelaeibacter cavernicola]
MLDRRRFLSAVAGLAAAGAVAACTRTTDEPKAPLTPDLSGADDAIRPQDDLFRHVNGKWLNDYTIPADKSRFGAFDELDDQAQENLRKIIEGINSADSGSDEQKIRDLYGSYLNTAAIDRAGTQPIADLLDAITKAQNKSDLITVMGTMTTGGAVGLIELDVYPDAKNPTRYVANLAQSGIGLPDESYYREPDYAEQRDKYRTFVDTIGRLAALPNSAGIGDRVLAIETAIAAGHWDNVRTRDSVATYNPFPWDQLPTLAPGFDFETWAKSVGGDATKFATVIVAEPSFLTHVAGVWTATDIEGLRDYLRISVIRSYGEYLAKDIADAKFDFFSKTLKGVQQQPDRWKEGITTVDKLLGEALGKKYVAAHFPADAKKQADDLVGNLLAAYKNSFDTSDWMTEPTRKAAIEKLGKITTKIGYPDKWRDYSKLQIEKDKIVANVRAGNSFESARQLAKLGTPVTKDEWQMTPQTVNAYYDPSYNEIVFPAAILQSPFFSPDAEPAMNYGGIGAVIGHEIGHGFDDQGSTFDGDGLLRDWWTPQDRAAFDTKTKALIAQYEALVPAGLAPTQHVNGALTIGENLADLGGLSISLAALKIAEQKAGNTPKLQDVFLSWGRIWRGKERKEAQIQGLATDPHSPTEFRCNQVVRNVPDFYAAFDVKATDKEFLPEQDRVRVW